MGNKRLKMPQKALHGTSPAGPLPVRYPQLQFISSRQTG
jgi:hypothetical protein